MEAAFIVGPFGALVLLPLSVMTVVWRRPAWGLWVAAPLVVGTVVSWLAYWLFWGRAFELADTYQPVPESLLAQKEWATAATAAFMVALVVVAVVSLARPRRGARPASA